MSECYVCLEETDETSPCTCAAPMHKKCFKEMQTHSYRHACSICKRPFIEPITWKHICFCVYAAVIIIVIVFFAWIILVEGTIS